MDNEYTDPEYTGTKWTRTELKAAFERVQAENWKDPIDANIPATDMCITNAAIRFYTGSVPNFTIISIKPSPFKNLRVTATGYYAAVGA
jgi:hypothetical protein